MTDEYSQFAQPKPGSVRDHNGRVFNRWTDDIVGPAHAVCLNCESIIMAPDRASEWFHTDNNGQQRCRQVIHERDRMPHGESREPTTIEVIAQGLSELSGRLRVARHNRSWLDVANIESQIYIVARKLREIPKDPPVGRLDYPQNGEIW
jgi:hypothetical protein